MGIRLRRRAVHGCEATHQISRPRLSRRARRDVAARCTHLVVRCNVDRLLCQKLRFINVHTNRPSMRMRLRDGETLVRWRIVAKDGMDLPADQLRDAASEIQMGNGETYDVEFVPARAGDL